LDGERKVLDGHDGSGSGGKFDPEIANVEKEG
jgi:hypothetical protein